MVINIETQNWTVCRGRDFGMLSLNGMFALFPSPKGLGSMQKKVMDNFKETTKGKK